MLLFSGRPRQRIRFPASRERRSGSNRPTCAFEPSCAMIVCTLLVRRPGPHRQAGWRCSMHPRPSICCLGGWWRRLPDAPAGGAAGRAGRGPSPRRAPSTRVTARRKSVCAGRAAKLRGAPEVPVEGLTIRDRHPPRESLDVKTIWCRRLPSKTLEGSSVARLPLQSQLAARECVCKTRSCIPMDGMTHNEAH